MVDETSLSAENPKIQRKPQAYLYLISTVFFVLAILTFLVVPLLANSFASVSYKPNEIDITQIEKTTDGNWYVDGYSDFPLNNIDAKQLWGWAFLKMDKTVPVENYLRFLVLIKGSKAYQFPVQNVSRQGVQDHFAELDMDLINSGFKATIVPVTLPVGIYSIGIVFQKEGMSPLLLETDVKIKLSYNSSELQQ